MFGGSHQFILGHYPVDQTDILRALGIDGLAHQLQFHGDTHSTGVDEANDPPVGEVHATANVEESEGGIFGGDADVAGQSQLDTASDHPPVEGRDDWFASMVQAPCDASGEAAVQQASAQFGARLQPGVDMGLQIGSGAERLVAGTGEYGDSHLGVAGELRPCFEQQIVGLCVDRVPNLRPVQGDVGDSVALFVDDFAHAVLLLTVLGMDDVG